jgi:hypothetical protein
VKVNLWQGNFIAVDLAAERGFFDNDSRRIDGKAPRYRYTIVNQHAVLVDPGTCRPAGLWSSPCGRFPIVARGCHEDFRPFPEGGGRILTNVPTLLEGEALTAIMLPLLAVTAPGR